MGKNREFWRGELTRGYVMCRRCDGTGVVIVQNSGSRSWDEVDATVRQDECYVCSGTGRSFIEVKEEQDDEE